MTFIQLEHLTYIREVTQSKKLNELTTPCIIISASGMAEAGRIRHHLRQPASHHSGSSCERLRAAPCSDLIPDHKQHGLPLLRGYGHYRRFTFQ